MAAGRHLRRQQFTLQVGLANFQGTRRTEWAQLMAGNVIATAPLITMSFTGRKG